MKKLLILLCGAVSSSIVLAQTLQFEPAVVDYGTINEKDGMVSKTIIVKNVGDEPLVINNFKDPAVTISYSIKKTTIKPGKSTDLTVTLNPKFQQGSFSQGLYMETNDTKQPLQVINVKAEIEADSESVVNNYRYVINSSLKTDKVNLNLQNILNTEVVKDTISLLNISTDSIRVSFVPIPEYFEIKSDPEVLPPYSEGKLYLTFDVNKSQKWGTYRDRLYWEFDGEQSKRGFSISANIKEDFSGYTDEQMKNAPEIVFETTEYKFDTLQQGESASHSFKFKNTGKSDLIIRNTKASCGCTATKSQKSTIAPGEESEIDVTFNSRGKRGSQNKSITITTNDPKNPTVVIYMRGFVNTSH